MSMYHIRNTCIAFTLGLAGQTFGQLHEAPSTVEQSSAANAELLADAQTRLDLTSDSSSRGGHDGSFYLSDPEANSRLNISGLMQFRYAYGHIEDEGSKDTYGFYVPRARIWVQGKANDRLSYRIRMQFSGSQKVGFAEERTISGFAELDQAWIAYKLSERVTVRVGEQASEFSRENDLSPQDQLGVNASPTDTVFGLGGYQGIRLGYEGEEVRTYFTFSNGARNKNTMYDDPRNADYALTFKGDWLIEGKWSQFSDFTSRPGSETGVMVGAGVHWENGAQVGSPTENLALLMAIGELSIEGSGWAAYAAVHYSRNTFLSASNQELNDLGMVLQGSLYLSDSIEPYLRFDAVFPDSNRDSRNEEFKTLTGGFNYYPYPTTNDVKLSFDLMYMFDDEAGALVDPSANAGVLASDEDGQIAARAQITLRF